MKHILKGTLVAGATLPFLAFAQTDASSILGTIGGLINAIIPILIAAALAWFIFGVIKFMITNDADEKGKARNIIIQGIIGLFVIVSVWGLVGLIQSTFGIGTGGTLTDSEIPGVQLY